MSEKSVKAMGKQELADCAGVSVRTLMRWIEPYRQELAQLGMRPNSKVLPPKAVAWIAEHFCIET